MQIILEEPGEAHVELTLQEPGEAVELAAGDTEPLLDPLGTAHLGTPGERLVLFGRERAAKAPRTQPGQHPFDRRSSALLDPLLDAMPSEVAWLLAGEARYWSA